MATFRSRRALLVGMAGTVGAVGCLSGGDGGESVPCDAITVESSVDPRSFQQDDVTLYEDYVVVEVTVEAEDPPALQGRIEACEDNRSVTRELSAGTQSFEFGPFGHHCVQDHEFWIEGCR